MDLYNRMLIVGGFIVALIVLAGIALGVALTVQRRREREDHFDVGRSSKPTDHVKVSLPFGRRRKKESAPEPRIAADTAGSEEFDEDFLTADTSFGATALAGVGATVPPPPSVDEEDGGDAAYAAWISDLAAEETGLMAPEPSPEPFFTAEPVVEPEPVVVPEPVVEPEPVAEPEPRHKPAPLPGVKPELPIRRSVESMPHISNDSPADSTPFGAPMPDEETW